MIDIKFAPKLMSAGMGTALVLAAVAAQAAPQARLTWPLGRTAYQTNEWIDLGVVRSDTAALAAGDLSLTLTSNAGDKMTFTFPAAAVPLQGNQAASTEHLRLNGWLLRPGHYTVTAAVNDATATGAIDIASHVRSSSFKIVNWSARASIKDQLHMGPDGMGYNVFLGATTDQSNLIRSGIDYMRVCTMSGGHQMDLRMDADWSDPFVTRGGTARVVREAFASRTSPNVIGVHMYDEPGLTWWIDPETKEFTPHGIPAQVKSFKSAFDREAPKANKIDAKNPVDVANWNQWAKWKLGFMDAAWQEAQFGLNQVRPDLMAITQSQYGWTAFTDGYYFNVVRSLPLISGHGGYDDIGIGIHTPALFLEMSRARDMARDCWYLPTWYGVTPDDRYRAEQYMSFITGVQGMASPPELDTGQPTRVKAAQAIVETNKQMLRLGTIFNNMPVTRGDIGLLYSLSQMISDQTKDRTQNYAHATKHGAQLTFAWLAGKMLQQQFTAVLDEDIIDGTVAGQYKAIVLPGISYLDPKVVAALEQFAAQGGSVILTGGSTIKIKGAIEVPGETKLPDQAKIDAIMITKKYEELGPFMRTYKHFQAATPLAAALKAQFEKIGLKPVLGSDQNGLTVSRQAAGDIEYFFAVNATPDEKITSENRIKSVNATITLPGGALYDAVGGGKAGDFRMAGQNARGAFRFGPGQMRAWARTARPIGSIKAAKPNVVRDYSLATNPLQVRIGATLLDDKGGLLSGAAPLEVRLIDPRGATRYSLYRATGEGLYRETLPLALNDAPGVWSVTVRDLLANSVDTATFMLGATGNAGAAAGSRARAVFFGNDNKNVFRMFRTHHDVTIVPGTGDYNAAAAERLANILKPWGVRAKIMSAAEAGKTRVLTEEEATTWIGKDFRSAGQTKPGVDNGPMIAGFAVQGPVVLLGTPEDNTLLKFVQDAKFLPYAPKRGEFPGNSRGYYAWQRDAVGQGQESVSLIAYDQAGMSEAVGSLYEAVAGMDPLTPVEQPNTNSLAQGKGEAMTAGLATAWTAALPDRALNLQTNAAGSLLATTFDGSLVTVDAMGKITGSKEAPAPPAGTPAPAAPALPDAAKANAAADQVLKAVATGAGGTAAGYWGGLVQVFDAQGALKAQQQLPQDVTALTWQGKRLVAALADGSLVALDMK